MSGFEKPGIDGLIEREEKEKGLKELTDFIKTSAESYRAEGLPVDEGGRIDMRNASYKALYADAEQDFLHTREGQIDKNAAFWEQKSHTDGEKLEMLAYAIFMKSLGEEFVVVRSAPHDDKRHNVDTLIFDRETGNLVCAFDEVGDTAGSVYEEKRELVQQRNLKGGAELKYALRLEEKDGVKTIVPDGADHIPLFYIALPKDRIEKGIKEFAPGPERSEFEKRLFKYFIAALDAQIQGLELYKKRLDPALRDKLTAFKTIVKELE